MLTEEQYKNLKVNIAVHLQTFSKNKWLSSRYFYEDLIEDIDFSAPEGRKKLEEFQRILAYKIGEIIQDQYTYKQYCVVSSEKGYKIANEDEDYEIGQEYLFKKIDEPLKRINFIKEMRKEFLKIQPDSGDLFLEETVIGE
jgi:hypothetical protein